MSLKGNKAPDFTLPDENGKNVSLTDYKGKRLMIVFYPGDGTPVCTKQLCSYNDEYASFKNLGLDIIGINKDTVGSHKLFQKKFAYKFPLLSDPDKEVAKKFDAVGLLGNIKRAVYVLNEEGIVIYEKATLPILYPSTEELLEGIKKAFEK